MCGVLWVQLCECGGIPVVVCVVVRWLCIVMCWTLKLVLRVSVVCRVLCVAVVCECHVLGVSVGLSVHVGCICQRVIVAVCRGVALHMWCGV